MFKGVRVGQVTNVLLLFNPKDLTTTIPVYIEIDTGQISTPEEYLSILKKSKQYQYIKPLIDKGLKGQLQMQSFVTGQLAINLDFHPNEPVRLVGLEKKYHEVPTIPTSFEEMTKTFQELDIKGLSNKFTSAIDGLNKLINAPGASETLTVARDTLKQTEKTLVAVENMTGDYANLKYEINSLFREFSSSSRSLRDLFDYLERHPESLLVGKKNVKGD
jgi:paraquat-inducible protein B